MKKRLLFTVFMLASIIFAGAQLREIGSEDVLIEDLGGKYGVKSKISVADNGWIYVMEHSTNEYVVSADNKDFIRFLISKDDGKTYNQLSKWTFHYDREKLVSADFVVTGKDEDDIYVWVVYTKKEIPQKRLDMNIHKLNSKTQHVNSTFKPIFLGSELDIYPVAIATDYRSPGTDGTPYTVAAAYGCYFREAVPADAPPGYVAPVRSYIGYFYTLDAGENYMHKYIYDDPNDAKITDIDISLGTSTYIPQGRVAIVAQRETSESKEVILLMDRYDFRTVKPALPLDKPLASFGIKKVLVNPKIQMICDNALDTKNTHVFAITATEPATSTTYLWYPKPTFNLGVDVPKNHIGELSIPGFSELSLAYDKTYHNFLSTYYKKADNRLEYTVVGWDNIADLSKYILIGYYHKPDVSDGNTSLDINPTKTQACFTWTETYKPNPMFPFIGYRVLADYEWATSTGVDEIKADKQELTILSKPGSDEITLQVTRPDNYTANLYDIHGKSVKTFSFSGSEYTFGAHDLATGIYILRLNAENRTYRAKLVVE